MPATTTSKPVIPAPTGRRMINGAAVHVLSVDLDNVTVVYSYDMLTVTLSVVDRPNEVCATSLGNAIRTQTILGREVFRGDVECGGGLSDHYAPTVVADEFATLLQVIPHLYQCLQAAQERKTMRSVYRYLQEHMSA